MGAEHDAGRLDIDRDSSSWRGADPALTCVSKLRRRQQRG